MIRKIGSVTFGDESLDLAHAGLPLHPPQHALSPHRTYPSPHLLLLPPLLPLPQLPFHPPVHPLQLLPPHPSQ